MTRAQCGAAVVLLILASAVELQAQTCLQPGRTNIFSESSGVAVVNSDARPYGRPEQIAEAREFWNSACNKGGGVDYPLLTDTPTPFGGVIRVEFHVGASETLNTDCDCHPVAEWHAPISTIIIYGQYTRRGAPTDFLVPNFERDGVRIVAHELGHALGLGHYRNTPECTSVPSIMQPSYTGPRDVFPEDCELLDRLHPMPGEGCSEEICTYTLRGHATMPPYSGTSVGLTAGFTTPGQGDVTSHDTIEQPGYVTETIMVTSDPMSSSGVEFAFSTPLGDGTTYQVDPTVPDHVDCYLSFATGTVSGGDPQELNLFCGNKIPSFCDLYPRACSEAGYDEPPDVPWTIVANCQWNDVESGYSVPCTDPVTGEVVPGECYEVVLTRRYVCDYCFGANCLTTSPLSVPGPEVAVWTPREGATVTGRIAVKGSAYHPSGTMDGVRVWVDNQPVSLQNYQTGLYAPSACTGQPAGCNPNAGFKGFLDTSGLTEGPHELMVISVEDSDPTPGFTVKRRTFVVDHTPPPSDSTPPAVSLTAPASGALVTGTVTIAANASDNVGVTKVELYVDGVLKGTDTTAPYSYNWSTTTPGDGTRSLTAKAYDSTPNVTTSAAVPVTVDNTVPRLYIDAPAAGASVSGTSVSLYGWATDASRIATLAFKLDGQPLALNGDYQYGTNRADVCSTYPGDPNCPLIGWYAFFDSTRFSSGAHTLEMVATDRAGLTASMQRAITINN